jgi:hypothetical protein
MPDSATSLNATQVAASQSNAASRSFASWWKGVCVALVVALPLGWLLSFAAALVALLGLFFFALFGLVLGAILYRFGVQSRPIPVGKLRIGVVLVVATCWICSMWLEVAQFAGDKANYAVTKIEPLPEGRSPAQVRSDVERHVRDTLERDFGGSGFLGYARWSLTSGKMQYQPETMKRAVALRPVQYRWWWAIRVALSIVFLSFGVYAQVKPLTGMTDPAGASVAPQTRIADGVREDESHGASR